jgi:hypothetical protein
MALAPWDVLNAGKIRSDAEEQRRRETGEKGPTFSDPNWERTEDHKKMTSALEKVARELAEGDEVPTVQACMYYNQEHSAPR